MLGFPSKTKESASWCLLISQADNMPSWRGSFYILFPGVTLVFKQCLHICYL